MPKRFSRECTPFRGFDLGNESSDSYEKTAWIDEQKTWKKRKVKGKGGRKKRFRG